MPAVNVASTLVAPSLPSTDPKFVAPVLPLPEPPPPEPLPEPEPPAAQGFVDEV